jgi:hypothetical protein
MKIDKGLMWLMKYKSVSFHAVVVKMRSEPGAIAV